MKERVEVRKIEKGGKKTRFIKTLTIPADEIVEEVKTQKNTHTHE